MIHRSADAPGEARVRLMSDEVAAVIAGRMIAVTQLLATIPSLRRQVKKPAVLLSGIGAITAQMTWAALRLGRTKNVRDPITGWSDVVATAGALAIEAASWGSRDIPADPRWSLPFSVVVSSWVPFELDPPQLAAAGACWSTSYLATTRSRSPARATGAMPGQRWGELLAAPVTGMFCRRFAVHLRRQAVQMDEARDEAVRQAVHLAEEEERSRQYRIVHDSAIQVLEAVAGDWEVDEGVLLARIDFEIERLQRVLSGGGLVEGGSLRDALVYLAEEFRLSGIEIILDVAGLRSPCAAAATQALANAAHEALVNVRKHSGVASAWLEAADDSDGIRVVIRDEGRGFDAAARRRGFGLDESIGAGIAAVGGAVEILARPGTGTTIRLWVPRVRSTAASGPRAIG